MTTPKEALDSSRVDLIGMIRDGIPPREYVPGCDRLIPKGKRVHIVAEKKTGKSVSIGGVTAVQIAAAGGTAVVLDRENGPDESARRVQDVLDARDADDAFRELVKERLHYHAWPTLSLDWSDGYPEAFGDADIVIFDSSRQHLTPLGLDENSADDWSKFSTGLIDPLMQAGISTITLDNTGHTEKDRARGTSSKEDLADIVFTMKALSPFSATVAGRLELCCTHSRIGEITPGDVWHMTLGAGRFGTWQKTGARPPEARDELREAAIEVLRDHGGVLGSEKVAKAIRARPGNTLRFGAEALRAGLDAWAADPTSGVLPGPSGRGFTAHVGQLDMATVSRPGRHGPTRPTPDTGQTQAPTGDLPVSDSPDTTRHGAHVACSPPLRGDTDDMQGSENDHNDPHDGWSDEELQQLIDSAAAAEQETTA